MPEKNLFAPEEILDLQTQTPVLPIDVRDADDFEAGHIPGAVNAPELFYHLSDTDPESLAATQEKIAEVLGRVGLGPEHTALLYEDTLTYRFGGSCRGWWWLNYLGHSAAGVLDGGFDRWRAAGLPVETGPVSPQPRTFEPAINDAILATKEDVLAAVKDGGTVLLDNRDQREWMLQGASPYDADGKDFVPQRGRIPGARWIEWVRFMEDGAMPRFKTPQAVHEICAEAGISQEDDIIIYCFKGSRASNTFIALKEAGFPKVRNYLGSWYEWSRTPGLPVDRLESAEA
jgi:thiosulfate/3-mercaptopyruvate sulfurtransferase